MSDTPKVLPLLRSRRHGNGSTGLVQASMLIGPALTVIGLVLLIVGQTNPAYQTLLSNYSVRKKVLKGPTKEELGRSSWTLIHTMAANYPQTPTHDQQTQAKSFFTALGSLYPCPLCRDHFDRYIAVNPPDVSTREKLLLWTCEAHNEVNRRKGKRVFPCTVTALDKRWGDCGCDTKTLAMKRS